MTHRRSVASLLGCAVFTSCVLVAGCGPDTQRGGGGGGRDATVIADAEVTTDDLAPAGDVGIETDLSVVQDLSIPDFAPGADLTPVAMPDLAKRDLAPLPDLALPPDLKPLPPPPDLLVPPPPPDLLVPPPPPDLLVPPPPDLSMPPPDDLSMPPPDDLSMAPSPDLTMMSSPPDLTAPPPDLRIPTVTFTGANATTRYGNASGGNPYEDACPAGQALIGYSGALQAVGTYIGQLTAMCGVVTLAPATTGYIAHVSSGQTLPTHGIFTAAPFTRTCPADQVIVGFGGRSGALVDQLVFRCAPLAVGADLSLTIGAGTDLSPAGGNGGNAFAQTNCPAGQVATVSRPRAGDGLDAFGLACSTVTFQ